MPGASSIVSRIILLILLVAFMGCKATALRSPPALPPPLPAGPAADTTSAQIARGWIDVTVSIPRNAGGPVPVVISPIVADETLLARGFAVARFHTNWEALRALPAPAAAGAPAPTPIPGAAPRAEASPTQVGNWLLAAPRPGIVGRAYFDIISMDAENVLPQVVDYLTTLPGIDPRRIALTGSSTSGFVALQGMAAEPRIAVGVARVTCGDYMTFLKSSSLALNDDPRWLVNGKVVLDPDYAVEIAAREPIRNADRYPPRPLLLLAGERDRAIPFACVENTVRAFRSAYAARGAADRFRFLAFASAGHNLSDEDNAEIVPWLERWLGGVVSASAR